jgi:Putative MetA-pathway of phenol degradation
MTSPNFRIVFLAIFASIITTTPLAAQSLPVPTMNIPEASSKRGFDWGFSTGFDYVTDAKCNLQNTSVSCTSTTTSAFSVPSTVMAQFNRLRVQVTVPFVDLEGPGTISGVLGVPEVVGSPTGPASRRYGLGDVSVGAAIILLREGTILPRVELGGIVKAPTGKDGLGTGKTDYGAQISLYRPLWSGAAAFGSAGYQWVGDTNTVDLHKGAVGTAGLDLNYGFLGGGALLDYNQSLLLGLPNSFTIDPYVTFHIFHSVGLQAYTTFGLTRLSPNHGVGVRIVFGSQSRE